MKNLNALFYPELVCLDEGLLKYLILMYDKIYFLPNDIRLNPGHTSISSRFSINDNLLSVVYGTEEKAHDFSMYGSEKATWNDKLKRLMETYDRLQESGTCVPLQDIQFESPHDPHPLKEFVDADLADGQFRDYCNRHKTKKISIPPSAYNAEIKGGIVTRPNLYPQGFTIEAICSERINSSLYFANKENLVPVTDNDLFLGLISSKLQRLMNNSVFWEKKAIVDQKSRVKVSLLAWEIFTEIVPNPILKKKKIKHILKYKDASAELQEKFRNKLFRLESMVNQEPWDERFHEEIDKIVKLEILPEVERIREKKKVIWEKLFSEIIKTSFSKKFLIPAFSIYLIPNVSYRELLCYSTAIGLGSKLLSTLLDSWREEREVNRNALFFLLNFK